MTPPPVAPTPIPPPVAQVVVTAPSLPASPADAAFSVQALDPAALADGARVDDALAQISGFSVYRRLSSAGANPTVEGVSLRGIAGSAASRTLVTLDGAPLNDPFGGWVIFNAIPSEILGPVSLVRGAGAGAYGAGALTGEIALTSAPASPGQALLDAEGGTLGHERVAGVASVALGRFVLTLDASQEHDAGWDPVRQGRGPADANLSLTDWTAGARLAGAFGATDAALSLRLFHEDQGSGLVGAASRDEGLNLALSLARAPAPGVLGWRAQAWLAASNLANTSVSVTPAQTTATLADNEYDTPALGVGANAALRAVWSATTLEAGFDLRRDEGEDREAYGAVKGVLRNWRFAGGAALVGGAYLEGTQDVGRWLLTANVRADIWADLEGHEDQGLLGGAASLAQSYANRGGVTPTARLGARYTVSDALWLRA
ncbi:MAG: TonB-dependent receptor plug domain-containing protein, partial [Alphaproteobacteria bacterium]|nr:TonB-dependent receptor plug domain-containing protein [Alphaproteobacteria bacterium]